MVHSVPPERWVVECFTLFKSAVCLMTYYGGRFDRHSPLPFPVSLTRSGLPRCIPAFHRKMISRRDEKADRLVKFFLSKLSLSRFILVYKKTNYGY